MRVRHGLPRPGGLGQVDQGLAMLGHQALFGHLGGPVPVFPAPRAARLARSEPEDAAVSVVLTRVAVDPAVTQRVLDGLVIPRARRAAPGVWMTSQTSFSDRQFRANHARQSSVVLAEKVFMTREPPGSAGCT